MQVKVIAAHTEDESTVNVGLLCEQLHRSIESESENVAMFTLKMAACTETAGNRCNSVEMAVVQWLRSHRFAHFNYCSTIASPISTIALKLSQQEDLGP